MYLPPELPIQLIIREISFGITLLVSSLKKLLKGKIADIYVTSDAPTNWYKMFSGLISIPDSYGIAVLKNAVLNHCGVKTRRISVFGQVAQNTTTAIDRQKYLKKVSNQINKM